MREERPPDPGGKESVAPDPVDQASGSEGESKQADWRSPSAHPAELVATECPAEISRTAGGLDHPADGVEVVRGPLYVTGWAVVHPHPVSRVDIFVNGVQMARARLGLPRPDVNVVLDVPEAAIAGFETWVDLAALDNVTERATIEAVVGTTDGAETLLGRREIAIVPGDLRPQRLRVFRHSQARTPRLKQPRFLIFAHDLRRGGAQLALLDVLAGIQPAGATVIAPEDGPMRSEVETLGARIELQANPPLDRHDAYQRAVDDLVSHFAPGEFDAVIVNTLIPFWAVDVARRLGLPVVWLVHEQGPLSIFWASWMGESSRLAVFDRAEAAFHEADEIVLVSAATEHHYRNYRPGSDFVVINNAIDVADLTARLRGVRRFDVRTRLGVEQDTPVVVCVGAIVPRKGQAVLVQAFPLIRKQHPDAHLVLAGALGGPYESGLRRYVAARDLTDSVHILPFSSDVVPWYAMADVAVSASDDEVQPGVLLEAMACGVPVVGTDVGGVSEIVTDGETGFLCEPSNVVSLAAAIDRALRASDDERAAIINSARTRVLDRHDSGRRRAAYAGVIRRLLNEDDTFGADA